MAYLTDEEFRRKHRAHLRSDWWKKVFAPKVRKHYGHTCCICGKRGWIVDHRRYWKNGELIFGQETVADVCLKCDRCNVQGIRTDFQHRQDRAAMWWILLLERLPIKVVKGLFLLFRLLLRLAVKCFSAATSWRARR